MHSFTLVFCVASTATTIRYKSSSNGISHWLGFKSSQKSLKFETRACEDARIILSSGVTGLAAYEVIIGSANNTRSTIVRYDYEGVLYDTVAEEDTPGVLDCSETRYFWMSWNNGLLELATGSSNGRRLVDWKDDSPRSVSAVALRGGASFGAVWQYSYQAGKNYFPLPPVHLFTLSLDLGICKSSVNSSKVSALLGIMILQPQCYVEKNVLLSYNAIRSNCYQLLI